LYHGAAGGLRIAQADYNLLNYFHTIRYDANHYQDRSQEQEGDEFRRSFIGAPFEPVCGAYTRYNRSRREHACVLTVLNSLT
jgi:hypothetical protein